MGIVNSIVIFIDKNTRTKGFTIVELLIVIVVIAILAAITIIAYNGISNRSRQSAMQSNIEQVAKQIENYKTLNSGYPSSLSLLNDGQGPKKSQDTQFAYTLSGSDYCLTIGSLVSSMTYNISNTTGKPQEGYCTGHTASSFLGFPSRLGNTNITYSYGTADNILVPIGSIPTGSWMIVVLTTYVSADNTAPAGWTMLAPRKTTNTLQTSIYAKIKQSGDSASQEFEAAGATGVAYINGVVLWGAGSGPVSSWTVGSFGDRFDNATITSALTPTINVPNANSLVLSIATERTNAVESNYTSLTGATPWIFIPQSSGSDSLDKNQTISIGYNEQANTGTSSPMTVVYPNGQTYNATAIQIAIPPAS